MSRIALASAVSIALALAPVAAAAAVFVTPKKALYCEVDGKTLVCWRPANGFTVHMTAAGKAGGAVVASNRGRHVAKPGRVLAYGKSWTRGSWTCTSRKLSLICLNGKSHGWALGPVRGLHLF